MTSWAMTSRHPDLQLPPSTPGMTSRGPARETSFTTKVATRVSRTRTDRQTAVRTTRPARWRPCRPWPTPGCPGTRTLSAGYPCTSPSTSWVSWTRSLSITASASVRSGGTWWRRCTTSTSSSSTSGRTSCSCRSGNTLVCLSEY